MMKFTCCTLSRMRQSSMCNPFRIPFPMWWGNLGTPRPLDSSACRMGEWTPALWRHCCILLYKTHSTFKQLLVQITIGPRILLCTTNFILSIKFVNNNFCSNIFFKNRGIYIRGWLFLQSNFPFWLRIVHKKGKHHFAALVI